MDKLDISLTRIVLVSVTVVIALAFLAEANAQEVIKTESITESTITTNGNTTTTLKSPPPSAISPTINTSNSDLCTFGVAGAVQTQILGISTGTQFTDENCERLKNAKTLYDMGMKVAAVSVLCQDRRVYDAMEMAGTPCPFLGKIGDQATDEWKANPHRIPVVEEMETKEDVQKRNAAVAAGGLSLALLLLLL